MMEIAKGLEHWEKLWNKGELHAMAAALNIGEAAKNIKDGNLWITKAESFNQYLKRERGYEKSQVDNFIKMWEKAGEYLRSHPELMGTKPTRIIRLIPHLTDENREELIHAAAHIPDANAFNDMLRNLKGQVATDDPHEHDFAPVNIQQCKICGLRRKV